MTEVLKNSRRKPKMSPLARKEERSFYLFIAPWIIGFLIFTAWPMIYSIVLSFMKWDLLGKSDFIGLTNYTKLFKDKYILKSLRVTFTYVFASVPLTMVVSLLLAVLLNQQVKALPVFRTLFYMPSLVSGVANAVLWIWMFNPDFGIINTALSVLGIDGPGWIYDKNWAMPAIIVMSMWGAGGKMLIYLSGLQNIPTQLYEAAEIDGANALRKFRNITLPMLTPVIFFNLVMGMISAFQTFTEAYTMTEGGPNYATSFFVYSLYQNAFINFKMGYASAQAWLLFVIIMAFTLIVIRSSNLWVFYENESGKSKKKGDQKA